MFGLDDWIAGLSDSGSVLVVVLVATLLGLRHATDPDHIAAVTTLVASGRDRAARSAARLGAWWGLGHAVTLVAFGLPILLAERYLPERAQQGAETAVAALIVFLAIRLLLRWRHGVFSTVPGGRGGDDHRHGVQDASRRVRHRPRARHGWQRRRRRPAARRDPRLRPSRSGRCSFSRCSRPSR